MSETEEPAIENTECPEGEHDLQCGWCFWYDKKEKRKSKQFAANLHKLCEFSTVEGFWRHYVHLVSPATLNNDVNLHMFRAGPNNTPMWESYPNGGCWIVKIKKSATVLSSMWQSLLLAAIGEFFEEPNVVGVTVAVRTRENLLSIWDVDADNECIRLRIGEKLREILSLQSGDLLEYKKHSTSLRDLSAYRNAKAYVVASPTNASA
jgi:translation initiation factor 4E